MAGMGRGLFLGAGAALLPGWALDLMDKPLPERARNRAAALSLKLIAPSIRDAMAEGGLAWRACARSTAGPRRRARGAPHTPRPRRLSRRRPRCARARARRGAVRSGGRVGAAVCRAAAAYASGTASARSGVSRDERGNQPQRGFRGEFLPVRSGWRDPHWRFEPPDTHRAESAATRRGSEG